MKNKTEIYRKAIKEWGISPQLLQTMEECSELIQAVSHFLRGREGGRNEIVEELADVEIMCEQLRVMFEDYNDEIDKIKERKLMGILEMLEKNIDD